MGRNVNHADKMRRKARLLREFGPVCWICSEDIDMALPLEHQESFTIDHIVPVVEGGENAYRNLRPAHLCCNQRRAAIADRDRDAARRRMRKEAASMWGRAA